MSDPAIDNSEEPVDEQLTEVVSYLDSELNDTGMNEVELRLVRDPSLREYADSLDRTWRMLDALEEVPASDHFIQKTMDSVATESLRDSQTAEEKTVSPLRSIAEHFRRTKAIPWFLAGVLGTIVGLTVSQRVQEERSPETDAAILRNLDLLKNYPRYKLLPDVESLRQLQLPEIPDSASAAANQEPLP